MQGADDPGRHAPLQTERVPDRHHRVAHTDAIGVPQVQRPQRPRVHVHLEECEIGRRVGADDPRPHAVPVGEAHLDLLGSLNHVEVRDDPPGRVDHEARPERLLALLLGEAERIQERIGLDLDRARRRDLDDAGRASPVDLVDRQASAPREVGRRDRGPGDRNLDGFGVVEDARELGTRERHPAPHHCCDEERGRARENAGRSQHEELLPDSSLSMVSARLTGPCGSVKHCCGRSLRQASRPNRSAGGRVRASPSPAPSENGQAFLALIIEVPLHLPTNDSVPVNDFFAGEKVPFAMKCSPVPPSGGM